MATFNEIPETALKWHMDGRGAVLATVIETWGSAPRQAGAQLVVSGEAEIEGSVSGGCVEGAVVTEALDALRDGNPRILSYGVSDDEAFSVGLACGGNIRVLVEPVGSALGLPMLQEIVAARRDRRSIGYLVDLKTWSKRLVFDSDPVFRGNFISDRSGLLDTDTFLCLHSAPLRLIVVGAAHIAQPLVEIAKLTGYDIFLVDPREAFATSDRFPDVRISHEWPDSAVSQIGLDRRTALVTLSHDPKIDDPAILTALGSDCFYIGALGSKRTHAKRVARLQEMGVSEDEIARIHAPVGLDIGAKSPSEIAISVMAELTQDLRQV